MPVTKNANSSWKETCGLFFCGKGCLGISFEYRTLAITYKFTVHCLQNRVSDPDPHWILIFGVLGSRSEFWSRSKVLKSCKKNTKFCYELEKLSPASGSGYAGISKPWVQMRIGNPAANTGLRTDLDCGKCEEEVPMFAVLRHILVVAGHADRYSHA